MAEVKIKTTDGNNAVTLAGPASGADVTLKLPTAAGSAGQYLKTDGSNGQLSFATVASPVTALNNATANELVTVGSTTTELDAEANLTFDGTNLTLGTGNLIVGTSGNGIDFSATSDSGGMVNELLDDYEEGTFTPTITKLSGTAVGITYDYQLGNYTKIGNVVRFHLLVSTDAFTANGADTIVIGGLPYTCLSGDAGWCPQHVFCSDTDIPIHTTLVGAATTYLYLYRWNSEAAGTISSIVATDLTTGTNANKNYIRITGSYVG